MAQGKGAMQQQLQAMQAMKRLQQLETMSVPRN